VSSYGAFMVQLFSEVLQQVNRLGIIRCKDDAH